MSLFWIYGLTVILCFTKFFVCIWIIKTMDTENLLENLLPGRTRTRIPDLHPSYFQLFLPSNMFPKRAWISVTFVTAVYLASIGSIINMGPEDYVSNFILRWKKFYLWCLNRSEELLNFFSQNEHWKGFSPVCVRTWIFKFSWRENRLPHSLHAWGFSLKFRIFARRPLRLRFSWIDRIYLVCIRMWISILYRALNSRSFRGQSLHRQINPPPTCVG